MSSQPRKSGVKLTKRGSHTVSSLLQGNSISVDSNKKLPQAPLILTEEQIQAAVSVFYSYEGRIEEIPRMLQDLNLSQPDDFCIVQFLKGNPNVEVSALLSADPTNDVEGTSVTKVIPVQAFVQMVNELMTRDMARDSHDAQVQNVYDAMQAKAMISSCNNNKSLNSIVSFNPAQRFSFGGPVVESAGRPTNPVELILEEVEFADLRDLQRLLAPASKEDVAMSRAFCRLGAQQTPMGLILDNETLMSRCRELQLNDSEVRAVLNIFDQDSDGEIDFTEFKRIVSLDLHQLGPISDNVLEAMRRLMGIAALNMQPLQPGGQKASFSRTNSNSSLNHTGGSPRSSFRFEPHTKGPSGVWRRTTRAKSLFEHIIQEAKGPVNACDEEDNEDEGAEGELALMRIDDAIRRCQMMVQQNMAGREAALQKLHEKASASVSPQSRPLVVPPICTKRRQPHPRRAQVKYKFHRPQPRAPKVAMTARLPAVDAPAPAPDPLPFPRLVPSTCPRMPLPNEALRRDAEEAVARTPGHSTAPRGVMYTCKGELPYEVERIIDRIGHREASASGSAAYTPYSRGSPKQRGISQTLHSYCDGPCTAR